jgi:hypothetical protein
MDFKGVKYQQHAFFRRRNKAIDPMSQNVTARYRSPRSMTEVLRWLNSVTFVVKSLLHYWVGLLQPESSVG